MKRGDVKNDKYTSSAAEHPPEPKAPTKKKGVFRGKQAKRKYTHNLSTSTQQKNTAKAQATTANTAAVRQVAGGGASLSAPAGGVLSGKGESKPNWKSHAAKSKPTNVQLTVQLS